MRLLERVQRRSRSHSLFNVHESMPQGSYFPEALLQAILNSYTGGRLQSLKVDLLSFGENAPRAFFPLEPRSERMNQDKGSFA
jgi:hypothetical protein